MADIKTPGGWSIKYGYVFLTGGAKDGKFLKIWMLFKVYDICIAWMKFGCCFGCCLDAVKAYGFCWVIFLEMSAI